ncbi:TauD/TfdA family dioxygenase [Actinopolymorpha alba]|uniref:TauD/TfdA family dioxygenase n=1 Tax=Actinopolymorpha alba TaxID=533267 RepID=UPI0003A068A5|nr:TauD/TfdA family dioxygenase [Actinopolymorpha alba]
MSLTRLDLRAQVGPKLDEWPKRCVDLATWIVETAAPQSRWPELAVERAERFIDEATLEAVREACANAVGTPVHVTGIPVVDVRNRSTGIANDLLLIGFLELAGQRVFGYEEQNAGALVQDIIPIPGKENSNSNAGRVHLGWHTDDAVFSPEYRAEGIALLGLVNEAESHTLYTTLDGVLDILDEDAWRILSEPRFRFATPESFHVFGGKQIYTERRPLISQSTGWYDVTCAEYSTMTDRWDEEAQQALETFRHTLSRSPHVSLAIAPGDCLIISNRRGLHSRDAVTGRRHLKRAYVRSDLTALRSTVDDPDEVLFSCEKFILR